MNKKSQLKIFNDQSTVSVLIILLCFTGVYFFLLPQFKDSQIKKYQNKADLAELKETAEKMESLKVLIDNSKVKAEARGVNFAQFVYILPAQEQMPEMIIQLDQIMAENSALGMTYTLSNPENDGINSKMKVSIQASGSYFQVKDLIDRLQRNIRPIVFDQISIKADGSGKVSLGADGSIRVKTISSAYSFK